MESYYEGEEEPLGLAQALSVAQEVILEYQDQKKLFAGFVIYIESISIDQLTTKDLREQFEASLKFQKNFSDILTTEDLVMTLSLHDKYKQHYAPTMVYRVAEELIKRLDTPIEK